MGGSDIGPLSARAAGTIQTRYRGSGVTEGEGRVISQQKSDIVASYDKKALCNKYPTASLTYWS